MNICIASGGFDPLHSGHLRYLNESKKLGDILIVALNSDEWLIKKKGKNFLPFSERKDILTNLKMIDKVIEFDDSDGTCSSALDTIKNDYPNDEIIFCNGGDRTKENIPEMGVEGITFKFGVGGTLKKNSSRWILKNFKYSKEKRVWGHFYELFIDKKVKVKELIIKPNKGMSYQRHFKRSELWFVSKGQCMVRYSKKNHEKFKEIKLMSDQVFHVPVEGWHQIFNPYNEPCHIIEIQYGGENYEDDIERLQLYENK
mgnify:CR=1 FL=1|tara:strand:- start:72 stop:842 length:771 start_codon:yes stop_codon:yes gene_type:complete